jgi:hypothetical protein
MEEWLTSNDAGQSWSDWVAAMLYTVLEAVAGWFF